MYRRGIAVVLVVLLVVLAGCSGGGPAGVSDGESGDDPDGETDAAGSDGSNSGDTIDGSDETSGSLSTGEWEPFHFDKPGRYEYEVFVEGQGEGTLVWEVTTVSDSEITVNLEYDVGDTKYQSEVTGSPETVQQQMMTSPAGSLMLLTVITPGAWYSERELEVGSGWSYQTSEGSGSFEVTGTETIGGVSCFTSEMKIDGSVVHAGCFAPDHGLAPYSAYYDDEGNLQMEMTLVSYKPGN